MPPPTRSLSNTIKWLIGAGALVVALSVTLVIVGTHFSPIVRERAIQILEERYQSKVQLQSLTVTLFPRLTVAGEGLEFRHHGRTDVPPMITIRRFVAHSTLSALLGKPMHIADLRLEGLKLQLPPKRAETGNETKPTRPATGASTLLVIDHIIADGTFLEILPRTAGKEPLEFEISRLSLRSVGRDRPLEFKATLTNPRPPGLIESAGHFGPWRNSEPGDTPVDGHYTFSKADLSIFKGIAGILSSTGDYRGRLNHIAVAGTTDTPDFAVSTGSHTVHLTTDFQATVDGADGDTYLQPVNAKFLGTVLICQGKVEHEPGPPGKTVALDVAMDRGRIEDLLLLTVKGAPVMTGASRLRTTFLLPPGPREVMDRLQLAGRFGIDQGRFTSNALQEKITDLSLRGQGRPKDAKEQNVGVEAASPEDIASHLRADFNLKDGRASFTRLAFEVPGARLALAGGYGLRGEQLDFAGTFTMRAKVSQAFTGWKSMLLKTVDPFFAKHGMGAEIPIRIGGTREQPSFALELFHRAK